MEPEGLVEGFYLVGEDREIIDGPFKSRNEARKEGFDMGVRFAILEVLEEFNNFAWGE